MAADSSLLQLEGVLEEEATEGGCSLSSCSSSNSSSGPSPVLTEASSRSAAIAAAAQAAALSERCRSLLPLLKTAAESSSSSGSGSGSGKDCPSIAAGGGSNGGAQPSGKLLEFDSDGEGPMVELDLGVGVFDVNGQLPSDARLAEMGVQVVDVKEDSPLNAMNSAQSHTQMDVLQRALAARLQSSSCSSSRPVITVMSSGSSSSSSDEEGDSDEEKDS